MIADFYHLASSPLEKVLPRICERLLEQGERLTIVVADAMLDDLDRQLWSYAREAFLPHGRAGAPDAERQPILLDAGTTASNGARNIAIADGRWRDEALGFDRAFYFFDDEHLADARQSWTTIKDNPKVEPRYWMKGPRGKWVEGP